MDIGCLERIAQKDWCGKNIFDHRWGCPWSSTFQAVTGLEIWEAFSHEASWAIFLKVRGTSATGILSQVSVSGWKNVDNKKKEGVTNVGNEK